MRVVDVDDDLFRQLGQVRAVVLLIVLDDVLHGGGGEEVVLLEAQLLALVVVVLGVKDLGDDLGKVALVHGADVVALVEVLHVDALGAAGAPQAQRHDVVHVVATQGMS